MDAGGRRLCTAEQEGLYTRKQTDCPRPPDTRHCRARTALCGYFPLISTASVSR